MLATRFLTLNGVGEIADFMPVGIAAQEPGYHWLVQRMKVVRGSMDFRMECHPGPDNFPVPYPDANIPQAWEVLLG